MEHGEISDQIKTSPAGSHSNNPRLRRDRNFVGYFSWEPFLQVDLGPANKQVTAFAMQGRLYGHNTWTVYLKYAPGDGSEWFNYTENGVTKVQLMDYFY